MIRKLITIAVTGLALSACTSASVDRSKPHPMKTEKAAPAIKTAVPLSASDHQRIESAVKSQLKDPYSAAFSSVTAASRNGGSLISICGLVNAKNSYGGYTGSQLFYTSAFRGKDGSLDIGPLYINDLVAATMSKDYCL